jgi:hypothetical protein
LPFRHTFWHYFATTENRYASAPGLRFIWQTEIIPEQHRLEFKLLNAEDCRHDFHFGTIQLKLNHMVALKK